MMPDSWSPKAPRASRRPLILTAAVAVAIGAILGSGMVSFHAPAALSGLFGGAEEDATAATSDPAMPPEGYAYTPPVSAPPTGDPSFGSASMPAASDSGYASGGSADSMGGGSSGAANPFAELLAQSYAQESGAGGGMATNGTSMPAAAASGEPPAMPPAPGEVPVTAPTQAATAAAPAAAPQAAMPAAQPAAAPQTAAPQAAPVAPAAPTGSAAPTGVQHVVPEPPAFEPLPVPEELNRGPLPSPWA